MIRLLVIALIWLNLSAALSAQTQPAKPSLTLSAEILSQEYCSVGPESGSLELKLRLRYANQGNEKLILYRGHDLFYQTRIRSVSNAEEGKPYEISFVNSRYFDEEFELIDAPAPSKVFVILPPGARFEREMVVGVTVVGEGGERGNSSVKPGAHTLQLIVSNWYKTIGLAQKLKEGWKAKGILWFQPLRTNIVDLSIAIPKSLPRCK